MKKKLIIIDSMTLEFSGKKLCILKHLDKNNPNLK